MDKKNTTTLLSLLALLLGPPLVFILALLGGIAAGLSAPAIVKLLLVLLPVFLALMVFISYWKKECVYIRLYKPLDTHTVTITLKYEPVLFHFLQAFLFILSIVLIITIIRLDITEFI